MTKKRKTLSDELEELERTNPAVRKAAQNYDKVVQQIISTPICVGCSKKPNEISEYVDIAAMTGESPNDYVRKHEGTFNQNNQHFYCTDCYIKAGMPLGKAP